MLHYSVVRGRTAFFARVYLGAFAEVALVARVPELAFGDRCGGCGRPVLIA
jgi:hypothetical protein